MIPVGMREKHVFYLPAFLQLAGHNAIAGIKQYSKFFYKIPY